MSLRFLVCFGFLINTAMAQVFHEKDQLDEFLDLLNGVALTQDIVYSLGGERVADACEAFMTRDSVLGENGRDIYQKLIQEPETFKAVFQGGTLNRYCPSYTTMNIEKRAMVWVLVFTMMAHFESTCNPSAHTKGKNGLAMGYYQFLLGGEEAHDANMDYCVKNASLDSKLSNTCAIATMEKQLTRTRGNLFSTDSYWDVLRPQGVAQRADDIQRALSHSSFCGASKGNTRL